MREPCPICKTDSEIDGARVGSQMLFRVFCRHCGDYQIEYVAKGYLKIQLKSEIEVAILSHAVRKMRRDDQLPLLDQQTIASVLKNPLPKPSEQTHNFVLWLGDNTRVLGKTIDVNLSIIQSEIGAVSEYSVRTIIHHLTENKIIQGKPLAGIWEFAPAYSLALTINGWEYYENLKRGSISSRKAFMAMQYGNQELDEIVTNYFRPAVKNTGYELYRLDDVPKAGLIDDRLRIEIRISRFLIADLTDENRGAYWEAGYAEGLGKPVIYTCEKSKFQTLTTHFDTNHHTTVLWEKNNLEKAAHELRNTIRATLPDEAKLTDD